MALNIGTEKFCLTKSLSKTGHLVYTYMLQECFFTSINIMRVTLGGWATDRKFRWFVHFILKASSITEQAVTTEDMSLRLLKCMCSNDLRGSLERRSYVII